MEDNFKRAVMELLVLTLLNREDLPAVQIMQRIEEETGHAIGLVSPYMLFYRLIEDGCILEAYKKNRAGWPETPVLSDDRGRKTVSGRVDRPLPPADRRRGIADGRRGGDKWNIMRLRGI